MKIDQQPDSDVENGTINVQKGAIMSLINKLMQDKQEMDILLNDPEYFVQDNCYQVQNKIDLFCESELARVSSVESGKIINDKREKVLEKLVDYQNECINSLTIFETEIDTIKKFCSDVDQRFLQWKAQFNKEQTEAVNNNYWSSELPLIKQIEDDFQKYKTQLQHMILSYTTLNFDTDKFQLKIGFNGFLNHSSLKKLMINKRGHFFESYDHNMIYLSLFSNEIRNIALDTFQHNDYKNLTNLSLSYNSINSIHPDALAHLLNLKYLYIDNNKIARLDTNIFQRLSNLKTLNMSNNQLPCIDNKIFQNLKALDKLTVSDNLLEYIEPRAFRDLSSLTMLNLSRSKIVRIVAFNFEGLSNLRSLNMYYNRIRDVDKDGFRGLVKLEKLELHINKIESVDDALFRDMCELKLLTLNLNKLVNISKNAFVGLTKLKSLNLSYNDISSLDEHSILDHLPVLDDLNLCHNKLDESKMVRTFKHIKQLSIGSDC